MLPNEIIDQIAGFVDDPVTLINLSVTCRDYLYLSDKTRQAMKIIKPCIPFGDMMLSNKTVKKLVHQILGKTCCLDYDDSVEFNEIDLLEEVTFSIGDEIQYTYTREDFEIMNRFKSRGSCQINKFWMSYDPDDYHKILAAEKIVAPEIDVIFKMTDKQLIRLRDYVYVKKISNIKHEFTPRRRKYLTRNLRIRKNLN
jgi:hypothetical protein